MPAPVPVELFPQSFEWAERAVTETARLKGVLGDALVVVHHIGSTAIPGIAAKPIVDLIPEVSCLEALDAAKERVVALGYEWWGEYGISGRRFCTLTNAGGKRTVHLHCFASGSAHIARHLAFRDYMRGHPDQARAYEAEKQHARALHPDDSHAYAEAKSAWIAAKEVEALAEWRASHPS
jgi:GrpB-like predicted nucleotidyltransferase (UPF0157 family)